MDTGDDLSDFFPKPPEKRHLHIIVYYRQASKYSEASTLYRTESFSVLIFRVRRLCAHVSHQRSNEFLRLQISPSTRKLTKSSNYFRGNWRSFLKILIAPCGSLPTTSHYTAIFLQTFDYLPIAMEDQVFYFTISKLAMMMESRRYLERVSKPCT
jgi:hypothetical protein